MLLRPRATLIRRIAIGGTQYQPSAKSSDHIGQSFLSLLYIQFICKDTALQTIIQLLLQPLSVLQNTRCSKQDGPREAGKELLLRRRKQHKLL